MAFADWLEAALKERGFEPLIDHTEILCLRGLVEAYRADGRDVLFYRRAGRIVSGSLIFDIVCKIVGLMVHVLDTDPYLTLCNPKLIGNLVTVLTTEITGIVVNFQTRIVKRVPRIDLH